MNKERENKFCILLDGFHRAQERSDIEEAEAIGLQCLLLAAEEAEENPSESLRLTLEAHEHENNARWEQAEATHRQALALAEAGDDPAAVFKACSDLRDLYAMRGMPGKALEEAQAAVQAARKADIMPLRAVSLEGLAMCRLSVRDLASATAAAGELMQIVPAEKTNDLQRARGLLLRARCRVESGETGLAQDDLDVAWRILAPQAKALMFAGIQGSLATWWEITARIRTSGHDMAGAAEAMGKAVGFRRTVSQLPHVGGPYKLYSLAKALQRYGVLLLAANEVEAANRAFDESLAIQRTIGVTIRTSNTV